MCASIFFLRRTFLCASIAFKAPSIAFNAPLFAIFVFFLSLFLAIPNASDLSNTRLAFHIIFAYVPFQAWHKRLQRACHFSLVFVAIKSRREDGRVGQVLKSARPKKVPSRSGEAATSGLALVHPVSPLQVERPSPKPPSESRKLLDPLKRGLIVLQARRRLHKARAKGSKVKPRKETRRRSQGISQRERRRRKMLETRLSPKKGPKGAPK